MFCPSPIRRSLRHPSGVTPYPPESCAPKFLCSAMQLSEVGQRLGPLNIPQSRFFGKLRRSAIQGCVEVAATPFRLRFPLEDRLRVIADRSMLLPLQKSDSENQPAYQGWEKSDEY